MSKTSEGDGGGWHYVCDLASIPAKKGFKARIEERDIAVFKDGDQAFALDARCYHAGAFQSWESVKSS